MEEGPVKFVAAGAVIPVAALTLSGVALRLGLEQAARPQSFAEALGTWLGSAAAAGLFLWALRRILKRGDWPWYPAASLLLLFLYTFGRYPTAMSGWVAPLAVLFVGSAGVLVWRFVQTVRHADELQRRILYEAFVVSFVVELVAVLVLAIGNDAGLSRLHAIWWGVFLVGAWSVGLAASAARYE